MTHPISYIIFGLFLLFTYKVCDKYQWIGNLLKTTAKYLFFLYVADHFFYHIAIILRKAFRGHSAATRDSWHCYFCGGGCCCIE